MKDHLKTFPIYKDYDFSKPLPFLTKSKITKGFPLNWQHNAFRERIASGDVEWLTTSGTSSNRLQIMRPKAWRQEQINKSYQFHPLLHALWQAQCKRVVLTTAVCSQMVCFKSDRDMAKRWVDRSLYVNLHHNPNQWRHEDVMRMMLEMNQQSTYILDADPFYLALFLLKLEQLNLLEKWHKPACVTLGYELCPKAIKQYITDICAVPIINIYGSTELGYVLMQQEDNSMFSCSEKSEIESYVVDADPAIRELVVTSYKNPYMPLLNYKTGDLVETKQCKDTQETIILRVLGRMSELYTSPNNQLLPHQLVDDIIYQYANNILFYQLNQLPCQTIYLNYVTQSEAELDPLTKDRLCLALQNKLGAVIKLSQQPEINPGHSGKFAWLQTAG